MFFKVLPVEEHVCNVFCIVGFIDKTYVFRNFLIQYPGNDHR